MNRVEIKKKAKEAIKGRLWDFWKGYLIYALVVGILAYVLDIVFGVSKATDCLYSVNVASETICYLTKGNVISEILSAILSLVTAFLTVGFVYYSMRYARGESLDINDIFKYKKAWVPTFLITFLITLFTSLWSLLLIVPGIIASLSYAMSYYIYCDEEKKPMECIKASKEMMKGHKWEFFVFGLSFIGWELLGILTLGLLYIWLIPYMTTAEVIYYDELKKIRK